MLPESQEQNSAIKWDQLYRVAANYSRAIDTHHLIIHDLSFATIDHLGHWGLQSHERSSVSRLDY